MTVDFNDEILIPTGDVGDFAVVACDQFSSSPEYWNNLAAAMPRFSSLDLVLPECFLNDAKARISAIEKTAAEFPHDRFAAYRGAVCVERTTKYGRVRRGIVASVNLSDYDYKPGNHALIRASERTIESRIPPRVEIREALDIELPHIMLLVDDRENLLINACEKAEKTLVYDGELKAGGGHIKGELITDCGALYDAVNKIIDRSVSKFGEKLFALVGDGNHSLATAKFCAEHFPTPFNSKALVEIVDIYDEGLVFEPIHRLVRVDDPDKFADELRTAIKGEAVTEVFTPRRTELCVPVDKVRAITEIDGFCEDYVRRNGGYVEYVHGDGALKRDGCCGIKMRGIEKSELFGYVVANGTLPKKTFSLGEAEEKRYYVEARKIK